MSTFAELTPRLQEARQRMNDCRSIEQHVRRIAGDLGMVAPEVITIEFIQKVKALVVKLKAEQQAMEGEIARIRQILIDRGIEP